MSFAVINEYDKDGNHQEFIKEMDFEGEFEYKTDDGRWGMGVTYPTKEEAVADTERGAN